MSKYIDVDMLKKDLDKSGYCYNNWLDVEGIIDRQPTADVRENVRGEWIDFSMSIKGVPTEACGVCCEWSLGMGKNFCPNCGAQMMRGEA